MYVFINVRGTKSALIDPSMHARDLNDIKSMKYTITICMSMSHLGGYRESSHGTKELFNLAPLILKAKHLSGSAFC